LRFKLKRIVVTGATGFIGRHCLPLLEQKGYEIHAFSSQPRQNENNSPICWHLIDLFDQKRLKALMAELCPSHLLHLAWVVEPGKWINSPKNYRWVEASLDLLLAFMDSGGKRAALAGSCAEYDWRYSYCKEGLTPLNPQTVYGTCKHSLQLMFDVIIKYTDISGVWGRIFFAYGPHEHPDRLVSSVIRSLLLNRPAKCSHCNQLRDYLYVKDVADAFITLLESNAVGPVNIASGLPIALKKIVFKIAEMLDGKDLLRLGSINTSPDEPTLLAGDITRLSKEVGWKPKYSLDQGIKESINWWEHNQTTIVKK
jgi:nucleoside-diphosphate-sugar epimerase